MGANSNIFKEMIYDSPIPYAMVRIVNVDGNEKLKLIDINKSFKDIFNVSKDSDIENFARNVFNENDINNMIYKLKSMTKNKMTVVYYLESKQAYYNIDLYRDEQDGYYIRFIKQSKENNKLSKFLKKSPFISWIKDVKGVYLDVNDKYLEGLEVKYEDIIGKTDEEIWPGEIATQIIDNDKKVIQENKLCIFNERFDYGKKSNAIFETAKWPYTDDNVLIGTMAVSIEVTDKVKLKEIIQKTEQNFLDIANNLDEAIIIRDEKKALYISPYFEELYGFKPDDLYEDINNWYKYLDKVEFLEEPKEYGYNQIDTSTFRIVKEGVVDKWIQSKFIPIFDDSGNVIRKIGLLKDITEKKFIDEELENLRIEFFANLSHELRTPINVILSALQVVNMSIEANINFDQRKYLNILSQNALRLTRLVNNLIDSTKINSGSFEFNPQNKDLVSFVENITMSVVEFVNKNNMEIIFDTDVEEKIIAFDLNHMERIILNLISNAIKFNKPGGKIEVIISTKDGVSISIKDEGVGIPKDKVESIFGRFEQVNKHRRREREGSGIGLSLVKSLVEMHNGTIEVKSSLYNWSEFTIILPDIINQVSEINENKIEYEDYELNQIYKMEVEFSDIYI